VEWTGPQGRRPAGMGRGPGLADHVLPAALRTRPQPRRRDLVPLRRGWLSNVAFHTPEHLIQRIRRGLRHIQYRSHLIDGCLAETGLTIRPT
jgi:hypothetical protein